MAFHDSDPATATDVFERLLIRARGNDHVALGRLLTIAERRGTAARLLAEVVTPAGGDAPTVGLTGPTGVGKSTLMCQLAMRLAGDVSRVAVLAIDPSSASTGGAVLGDRVRMEGLNRNPQTFVRSMATRGYRGGLAHAAFDSLRVLEAAGMDWLLVETVGVGQVDVDVAALVDTTVVVLTPGGGDHIQAAKAGLMEIADIFVVNKADRDGARETARELEVMVHMSAPADWQVPVVQVSAATGAGVDHLIAAIDRHRAALGEHDELRRRRAHRASTEIHGAASELVERRVASALEAEMGRIAVDDVLAGRSSPTTAALRLVDGACAETDPRSGCSVPGEDLGR